MLDERLQAKEGEEEGTQPADRCKIFLGFTSNVISVRRAMAEGAVDGE